MNVLLLTRIRRHLNGKHRSFNSSDAGSGMHKSVQMQREMITITVLCVTGVLLLILIIYCIRRRFNNGDSDAEAENPEAFKPPPTYDEVMTSTNFPVREGTAAANGMINVATIGNVQMQPGVQPPSYDSLATATTGVSTEPTNTPVTTPNDPPHLVQENLEQPPAGAGIPQPSCNDTTNASGIQQPPCYATTTAEPSCTCRGACACETAGETPQPSCSGATSASETPQPSCSSATSAEATPQPSCSDSERSDGVCAIAMPQSSCAEAVQPEQEGAALPV